MIVVRIDKLHGAAAAEGNRPSTSRVSGHHPREASISRRSRPFLGYAAWGAAILPLNYAGIIAPT
jgi:hypothetical protein